jgi:hypothetical protein
MLLTFSYLRVEGSGDAAMAELRSFLVGKRAV